MDSTSIEPGPDWHDVLERIQARPGGGRVGVLGSTGSGKSTFARWLGRTLAEVALTARLDTDPGQGTIGPPGTIGIGREPDAEDDPAGLCFVGDITPTRNVIGMVAGVARLADRSRDLGFERLVVDSPGYLDFPTGHALHLHLVSLLGLDHLVAVDGETMAAVLDPLSRRQRPAIHPLGRSPAVVERSRGERRRTRKRRMAHALRGARPWRVPAEVPVHGHLPSNEDDWHGRLVGVLDREGFLLQPGLLLDRSDGALQVRTAPVDPGLIGSVEVGRARINPD